MNQTLIEQIVANVLQELQPATALRAEASETSELLLDAPVITADVLQERVTNGQSVRIGMKSILTPSAREWLKAHNVRWQRGSRIGATTTVNSRRQLLASTVTPAVRTLLDAMIRDLPGWKHDLSGNAAEVADAAAHAINAAATDLIVVISEAADVVACRANRHPQVRSAVVASVGHLRLLVEHLGPNVLAINPGGRSFFDLRNLLRSCAALPAPRAPHGWD